MKRNKAKWGKVKSIQYNIFIESYPKKMLYILEFCEGEHLDHCTMCNLDIKIYGSRMDHRSVVKEQFYMIKHSDSL